MKIGKELYPQLAHHHTRFQNTSERERHIGIFQRIAFPVRFTIGYRDLVSRCICFGLPARFDQHCVKKTERSILWAQCTDKYNSIALNAYGICYVGGRNKKKTNRRNPFLYRTRRDLACSYRLYISDYPQLKSFVNYRNFDKL